MSSLLPSLRPALRSLTLRPHFPIPSSSSTRSAPSSRRYASFSTSQPTTGSRPFMIVLGIMPIFTFGLGVWQIKRLQWKLDMIDQLEQKLNKDTVRLPAKIDPAAIPEFAYRKVYLTGEFDHDHEILLGPKTRDGELGYHVITPLLRGPGQDTILVNRGFVKRVKKDRSERPDSETRGPVQVVGMLRDQEQGNSFTPDNTPSTGEWIWADIKQMAAYSGAQPVLVDEIFRGHAGEISMRVSKGVPVGRAATIELRNQHMTYAVTWFALSAATAFMFIRLVRKPNAPRSLTAAQFRSGS